uniref:Helix-turn-helix domain protein n=1 Tax=Podoviridae sp. ctwJH20 TaxID=2827753 RepID=A0A8S5TBI0_9CAUD|nr:MAG TPA: helix-turn-helix domain protein [Podoviridae sp. ctwJH20]
MNAETAIKLPKHKPRILKKEAPPDQRKVAVVPLRAVTDSNLTHGALRVLVLVCSYCNRAGITWVSQAKLAKDMGVSRQAISNQFKHLRDHGYIEIVYKGWKGERPNTIRVIFDKSVDTATAISITSTHEDTRPPSMKEEQIDQQGKQRIAKLVSKVLQTGIEPKGTPMENPTDTRTVKAIKETNRKGKPRRTRGQTEVAHQAVDNQPQDGQKGQPRGHVGVAQNTGKPNIGLTLEDVKRLKEEGLTEEGIQGCLEVVLRAYAAEGITPKPERLAADILQLNRDTNR